MGTEDVKASILDKAEEDDEVTSRFQLRDDNR